MPKYHDVDKLEKLLKDNEININDAVARGKFYENYFDWEYYAKLYEEGKSIKDICETTYLSYDAVRTNLKRNNVVFRKFQGKPKYENYLDMFNPLNNTGSYILGWIYSDGHVAEDRPEVSLALSKKDKVHVEYLSSLITDRPVREVRNAVGLVVRDANLTELLRKEYNMYGNKSFMDYNIPFEKFTKSQIPYLLLGLYEGDGCIFNTTRCNMLIPSKSVSSLEDILNSEDILIRRKTLLNEHGLTQIDIVGEDFFKFLHYLYSNTKDVKHLPRKKERFFKRLQISMNGKTSPYKSLAKSIWDSLVL